MTAIMSRPAPAPAPSAPSTAPIPFSRLLRVEWGKATDTRAARWLIGLTIAATTLIMLVPVLADTKVDQTQDTYLQIATLALATLLPVVSILTLTTEWSQRTVLTTFTQEPRRTRVINAKVAVSAIMALAGVVLGAAVTAVAVGISASLGRDVAADIGATEVLGFVLFVVANMAMGVAFGALLHNTAASIVLFFVLPTVFGILGAALDSVGRWIDPGTTFNWMLEGQWSGHVGGILLTTLVWVIAPLTAGLVRTMRREIV